MAIDPCLAIAILLLLAAAASDVARRIVPNRVCVALGLDGLVMQISAHSLPLSMLTMLGVFVPAAICWRYRLMGGGDVKLLAAATLLVQPRAVPVLVLAVALAGGLFGLMYWTAGHLLRAPAVERPSDRLRRILRIERHRMYRGFSLPYAVAISCGTLYVFGRGLPA